MKIYTICRFNQARSIVSAAVLRRVFPDLSIISAGVSADPRIPIPQSILAIARDWGLSIPEMSSTHFSTIAERIAAGDLLLCADEGVKAEVDRYHSRGTSLLLKNYIPELALDPQDPSGMTRRSTEVELAKVSALSVRALRSHYPLNERRKIVAFTPTYEDVIDRTCQSALTWALENQGIVFDVSWRAPHPRTWQRISDNLILLKEGELPPVDEIRIGTVLSPRFESDRALKWTLSPEIFTWLSHMKAQNIVLVTPPLRSNNEELPDSYLSALIAEEIILIKA